MIKYYKYILIALTLSACSCLTFAQSQNPLHSPYPIIFVHGLTGDNSTWYQSGSYNDIIDYLEGAGLQFGGNLNICLDYKRDSMSLINSKYIDVHYFDENPVAGDFYTINFNIHSNGSSISTIASFTINNFLSSNNEIDEIEIDNPSQFHVGDIIRLADEFMLVRQINGNTVLVKRGILNSTIVQHTPLDQGFNLSLESNQASIAKQGYGLKKAIEKIKDITTSDKVILVGHSMGGLCAREYIRSYYNNDVAKIVTIGTPHYGSNLASLNDVAFSVHGIDTKSEAYRDLKTGGDDPISYLLYGYLGVYLYGGNENDVTDLTYNKDVNSNGTVGDNITGLDAFSPPFPENVAREWIVSDWNPSFLCSLLIGITGPNDGVVLCSSQYIDSNDTLMTDRPHISDLLNCGGIGESRDYYSLLRGLDEPSDTSLAYILRQNDTISGFITHGSIMQAVDYDTYKLNIQNKSSISISLYCNNNTGISNFQLLDSELNDLQTKTNIYETMYDTLEPGTYYFKIRGIATNISYQYPYKIITNTAIIPPDKLTVIPANSLEYYDVVTNTTRGKAIKLINTTAETISLTGIEFSGTSASEFIISNSIPFLILPSDTVSLDVSLSPTTIGEKTATITIFNTSDDTPEINLALHGIGVSSPTRRLVMMPDDIYIFGNTKVQQSRNKIFQLQNTGSDTLSVSSLYISGMDSAAFSVVSQPALPKELASGEKTQFTVKFSPLSVGTKTSQLFIGNNGDNSSPEDSVALYGVGTYNSYSGLNALLQAFEYWYDDNYTDKVYQPVYPLQSGTLNTSFSTDNLDFGLHTFHLRFKDTKGHWSSVISEVFNKLPIITDSTVKITGYEYWFDDDFNSRVSSAINPVSIFVHDSLLNTASLTEGLHTFHSRYKDDIGQWNAVVSEVFNKIPSTNGERVLTNYEYWFDDDYSSMVFSPIEPVPLFVHDSVIDATSLPVGLHTFHGRYKDDAGQWSSVISEAFNKIPAFSNGNNLVTKYRYWYDLDTTNIYSVSLSVPVSPYQLIKDFTPCDLANGNHTIHFQFKDTLQYWSSVATDTFNLLPLSPPVITADGPVTICQGGSVTLTSTPANFYSWNNGDSTQSITVTVPGDYLVTVDNGCGNPMVSNIISVYNITVPAAPDSIEGDTVAIAGSTNHLYIITPVSGANSYIWSLPDGAYGISDSNSIIVNFSDTAVSGNITVYAVNSCGTGLASPPLHVSITVGFSINGNFVYNNNASTPLDSLWVFLVHSSEIIDSVQSDLNGSYSFSGQVNAAYTINATTAKPWGGVNGTDALKIQRHFAGLEILTEPVRLQAADVNNSGSVNGTDALKVKRRFAGLDNSFTRGDWTFAEPVTGGDSVIISGINVVQNFYGLCVGDVNGSNIPSPGDQLLSGHVEIIPNGVIDVCPGCVFTLPLRMSSQNNINAISLVISYPSEMLEVISVNTTNGEPAYSACNNEIRIAWSELQSLKLAADDTLILLRFKAIDKFINGISIDLEATPESELADETGNVIPAIQLFAETIKAGSWTGFNETDYVIQQFRIYPNPASDIIHIELSSRKQATLNIEITDMLGRIMNIKKEYPIIPGINQIQINSSDFVNGIYTIHLNTEIDKTITEYSHKVVIHKLQ